MHPTTEQTTPGAAPHAALFDSLKGEVDTNWSPDPWAWRDCKTTRWTDGDLLGPLHFAVVPLLGGRTRKVPILPDDVQVRFHRQALTILRRYDDRLANGVLSYRLGPAGTIEHYRSALLRRIHLEATHSCQSPYVVHTDIRSFFPQAHVEMLTKAIPDMPSTDALLETLCQFESTFGYALPEGYAASRAISNFFLLPVDESLQRPFTRWVDDYRVFVPTESSGAEVIDAMRASASQTGLALSDEKTFIKPSTNAGDDLVSVVGHPEVCDSELTLQAANERQFRLLLRMAAEAVDQQAIATLEESDEPVPATALPRLAWLISACADEPDSAGGLLRRELTRSDGYNDWRCIRLAPALWYLPSDHTDDLLDYLVHSYETTPVVRRALIRPLARHRPEVLRNLLAADDSISARWRLLALAEADRSAEGQVAISSGPPLESFL